MDKPVSFFTSAICILLALAAACCISSCLSGCADYQSHVAQRTVGARGTYNHQDGETTAEIYDSVIYR